MASEAIRARPARLDDRASHGDWRSPILRLTMRYHDVTLHGIQEAVPLPDGSVRLQRVTEQVRSRLEPPAQEKTLLAAGAEIRFVLRGPSARLTLSAEGLQEFQPTAHVFFGPLAGRPHVHRIGAEPTTIDVGIGDDQRRAYDSIPDDLAAAMPFHPRVVRIVLFRGVFRLHDVQGDLRPPVAAELPELTMLSYGTSITHGSVATAFHLTYVAQAAWRLGVDLINLGVGGACLCEPAFGDHIGGRADWDVATLALSVNMIARGFTIEEFTDRTHYLVKQVVRERPARPVFCITIYPYYGDWSDELAGSDAPPEEFRLALERVVCGLRSDGAGTRIELVPGPSLLTGVGGLCVDLIHPGDHGMLEMGERLAARMRPAVERLRASGVNRRRGGTS